MTTIRFAALLTAILSAFAISASAELSGGYRGLDEAAGMRLEFSGGGNRVKGVLTEADGQRRAFDADPLESGAETIIDRNGTRTYLLMTEEPLGVSVVAIPMTAAKELRTQEAVAYVFLRDGVDAPPKPTRYVPPPQSPGGTIDPLAFVDSYSFWPSKNVGYGYEMVRGRYRTLIRLHSVVQTDIVWKMCRSGSAPAGLAEALRGQGVTCQDVLAKLGGMMRSVDQFNRYRSDVEVQKQALIEAIRCSIDYRRSDPECRRAGARVARAATSLETVRSVLARY